MKSKFLCLTLIPILFSCSQKQIAINRQSENTKFSVSLATLKKSVIQHALGQFQEDIEKHRIKEDELSLRDHPFRYQGKVRAPLLSENQSFTLLEKEFGRRTPEGDTGPVDILEENGERFVLLYRQTIYEGAKKADDESTLRVFQATDFKPSEEEVKPKGANLGGSLWFESFIIDFDRAFREAKRDFETEEHILRETTAKG